VQEKPRYLAMNEVQSVQLSGLSVLFGLSATSSCLVLGEFFVDHVDRITRLVLRRSRSVSPKRVARFVVSVLSLLPSALFVIRLLVNRVPALESYRCVAGHLHGPGYCRSSSWSGELCPAPGLPFPPLPLYRPFRERVAQVFHRYGGIPPLPAPPLNPTPLAPTSPYISMYGRCWGPGSPANLAAG
jgi:hypothetical protein